jgi:hypothetical protein
LTYASAIAAWAAFIGGDTTTNGWWSIWPAFAMAPLGCAMLTARLIVHALAECAALLTGRDLLAELRPAASNGEMPE